MTAPLTPSQQFVEDLAPLRSDLVSFWVRPDDQSPALAHLEQIWSERERGQGHASRVMRGIMEHADRLGVELRLQVHWLAYDPADTDPDYDTLWDLNAQKLDHRQLYDWYARFGFVPLGEFSEAALADGAQAMVRPAQPVPAPKPRRP